jgi:6,7-dimethyl-8-ribityllumazine synthase
MIEIQPGDIPARMGVAVAAFNKPITDPMRAAAVAVFEAAGVEEVVVVEVFGALELPLASKALIERASCAGVVAIGAVIKGETDHYEHVATEATRGIAQVALETGCPVGNAILTVHEYDHALDRSRPGPGNKGAEAASAALDLARRLIAMDG